MAPNTEGTTQEQIPFDIPGAGQPPDYRTYKCDQCERSFDTPEQLRGHKGGGHGKRGKGWTPPKNRAEQLARRRIQQRKLRAGYYARGLDSHGAPRRAGSKPRRKYGSVKGKSYITTLKGEARERYLERQRRYQRNHYAKQKASRAGTAPTIASETSPSPTVVSFCPRCGCNIRLVTAAIQFGDKA